MKITILAVGSEAQYQPTFDTAYQYLKKETAALSAELSYAICRPDAAELFAALRNAMGQSEAVVLLLSPEPAAVSTALRVVCGGLERTAQTDAALQKQLEARAARMGLTLGYEQLADFASCPSGATQLPNAQGLVQGYAIAARRQLLMALPALPGELSALYPSAVRPLLGKLAGLAVSYATVRVLELDQFSVPQEITRLSQNPHLKLTSRHQCGDYTIFVEATGATQQEAEEYLQRAITHMQQTFGIYLYCIGDRPLPQIAVDGMTRHGLTLSTAEWGTGDLLREQLSAVIGNCWLSALVGVALAAAGMLFGERRGFARSLEKALWYTAFFLSLWCTAYCLRAQELDFRYMCPAFALAGGWTFWCDRREADHRPLRRLLFWLGWLPGIAAYLFILRSTLIALPTTFMYLFWPAVCGTAALLLKPRPTRRHRAAAALLAAGLLLACAVPKLCLVLETGWHCEPITAIQPERITRGPAAGTWAETKAADMQECLYEALAPYAGKSVLQAIGEQHGLGFLMADGTLTVAQASVISGTDSDPRFEQYYALLPEKQPDVILYDDAEVRDMAEFHAWIEQHFTITDRYTVQHGTASLQVLVVG